MLVMLFAYPKESLFSSTPISIISTLPVDLQEVVLGSFAQTFRIVFLAAVPITFIGFLLSFLLKEKPLKSGADHSAARAEASGEAVG